MLGRGWASGWDRLARWQGAFYLASGLWPLVHLPSFEAVTGRKRERWLVRTVGALIAVGGAALAAAGARRTVTGELALLGAGSAAALGAIDVWYGGVRRRIAPVYLADAVVEAGLVAAWLALAPPRRVALRGRRRGAADGAEVTA